jgi:hypothetical protein
MIFAPTPSDGIEMVTIDSVDLEAAMDEEVASLSI